MKKTILLIACAVIVTACKKSPASDPGVTTPIIKTADTIADKASFNIDLFRAGVRVDRGTVIFSHRAPKTFSLNFDVVAPATGSLALITSNNIKCSILGQPYASGMKIPLSLVASADATWSLQLSDVAGIPSDIHIKLYDRTDSVAMPYSFKVKVADTATYGSHRFYLLIK